MASKGASKAQASTFSAFIPEVTDRLQRVADTYLESYKHHAGLADVPD